MLFALSLLLFSLFSLASHAEIDLSWVQEMNKNYEAYKEANKETVLKVVKDSQVAIESAQKCGHFQAIQKSTTDAKRHLMNTLFKGEEKKTPEKPTLLVFVSFSQGLENLKNLSQQAHKHGGKLIIRGLVEGSFKKTAEVLKDFGEEILIDPTAFEEFNVGRVPTFVLRDQRGVYDKLSGNTSLNFALSQFAKHGDLPELAKRHLEGQS